MRFNAPSRVTQSDPRYQRPAHREQLQYPSSVERLFVEYPRLVWAPVPKPERMPLFATATRSVTPSPNVAGNQNNRPCSGGGSAPPWFASHARGRQARDAPPAASARLGESSRAFMDGNSVIAGDYPTRSRIRRASSGPSWPIAACRAARATAPRAAAAAGVNARVAASASRRRPDGVEVALGRLEVGVAEDVAHGHRVEHAGQERAGGVAEVVESQRRKARRVTCRDVATPERRRSRRSPARSRRRSRRRL